MQLGLERSLIVQTLEPFKQTAGTRSLFVHHIFKAFFFGQIVICI